VNHASHELLARTAFAHHQDVGLGHCAAIDHLDHVVDLGGFPEDLAAFRLGAHPAVPASLKIGRYLAMSIPPTVVPMKTRISGSRSLVSPLTSVSTSAS